VRNTYVTLSSVWTWAVEELDVKHAVRPIAIPDAATKVVDPLTQDEIQALLKACRYTNPWEGRPGTKSRRPTANRDKAIVFFLLDTGVRASEFCDVDIGDMDQKTGKVKVAGKALGRGSKERIVYLGKSARRAIWRYLQSRDSRRTDDPLFATGPTERPFERNVLRRLLNRMGKRAGLAKNVYPHRFRHTFSVNFLRNGGNVFELQQLLGHTSLEMVKRYSKIAQSDVEAAHRRASPVDNWRL
jgi:integrase/recombinase XerD